MLSGLTIRCQSILQRLIYPVNVSSQRNYPEKSWLRRGDSEATPLSATASKLRKRVKYKKPEWIDQKVLFVANFPKTATEAELIQHFSPCGFITEFKKFEAAPFGWCIFENERFADRARRELHRSWFQGQKLFVVEGRSMQGRRRPIPEVIATSNYDRGADAATFRPMPLPE